MLVFRTNMVRGGAGLHGNCSCESGVYANMDGDDVAQPPTMHDVLVDQGRMTPELRDNMRAERQRNEVRMARAMRADPYAGRVIGQATAAEAEMLPPTTLDVIMKGRR